MFTSNDQDQKDKPANTTTDPKYDSLLNVLKFNTDSLQDFIDYALSEALKLTKSKLGYIYFYSEEKKEFTLNTWSREVMNECKIRDPKTVYQLEKTGIWGEVVRQGKPIMVNNFQAHNPLKKGYPEGHAPLSRFLSLPVYFEDKIVAVIGLANKETDYTNDDNKQIELFMQAVWLIVEEKKSKQNIVKKNIEIESLNATMVNRELKMVELKKRIAELENKK